MLLAAWPESKLKAICQ